MIERQTLEVVDVTLRAVTAVSTLLLGIAASVIAYQQYRINKAKLKLDLFERRFALFQKLKEYTKEFSWKAPLATRCLDLSQSSPKKLLNTSSSLMMT